MIYVSRNDWPSKLSRFKYSSKVGTYYLAVRTGGRSGLRTGGRFGVRGPRASGESAFRASPCGFTQDAARSTATSSFEAARADPPTTKREHVRVICVNIVRVLALNNIVIVLSINLALHLLGKQ